MAREHRPVRRPHDATDLYLAPVTLAVDGRLEELALLSAEDLASEIAVTANIDPRSDVERQRAVVSAATYPLDLHGWNVGLSPRGLRLYHADHSLVLGLPPNVVEYLRG